MSPESYIKIHRLPEPSAVMVVSNNGECIDVALEVVNEFEEVSATDAVSNMMSDYIAPSNVSEAGAEPHHSLYMYRVSLAGADVPDFADELQYELKKALHRRHLACEVTYQR